MQEIIIDNNKVKSEFDRWTKILGSEDPYDSHETVGLMDVLRAHFLIADYFYTEDYGIGGIGPKSVDLLHSAIYRQFVSYAGKDKWASPFEKCATLIFGLVKDHPFHDANKRTALLSMLYFLEKINRTPTVRQKELEDFVVDIAEGKLRKNSRYKEFLKSKQDPEVYFIADYLKRSSRAKVHHSKNITFNQLNQCLKRHGFYFDNVKNGNIEVCRDAEKIERVFFRTKKIQYQERICTGIPFQKGWKSQVSKSIVSRIREATNLSHKNGVDSEAFFGVIDPLYALIDEYSNPLNRLAFR